MLIRKPGCHSPPRGAVEEADLKKIWFDDLLDRILFFMQCRGQCAKPDGTTIELFNDRQQQFAVHFIKAIGVDLHPVQSVHGDMLGYLAVVIDLGIISHAAEQAIAYSGCAARSPGDLMRTRRVDLDIEYLCRTFGDLLKFFDAVEIEMKDYPKAAAKRGRDQP